MTMEGSTQKLAGKSATALDPVPLRRSGIHRERRPHGIEPMPGPDSCESAVGMETGGGGPVTAAQLPDRVAGFLKRVPGIRHAFLLPDTSLGVHGLPFLLKLCQLQKHAAPESDIRLVKYAPNVLRRLTAIQNPGHTILVLDALDEGQETQERFVGQIHDLLRGTQGFHKVLIACPASHLSGPRIGEDERPIPRPGAVVLSGLLCQRIFFSPPGETELAAIRFAGTRLEGIHLEGIHLENIHLEGAHLEGAHLQEAHLEGAHLDGAHLEGAHLEGAHLENACLGGAGLRDAHLEGAHLHMAHLEGADLREAHLEGADLEEAHLEGADLKEAHLEGADLEKADFRGANLRGAVLKGAHLEGVHLEGANLLGAVLKRSGLKR